MDNLRKVSHTLSPFGLLVLRLALGVVMVAHGWQKLTGFDGWRDNIANMGLPAPDLFAALSMAAELGGGLLLILGLLTPIAALAVLVNMVVAIFAVHWQNGLFAQDGGFEYPLVLAASAFFLMLNGPGAISIDHMLFRRRRVERERPGVVPRYDREVPIG